MGTIWSVFWSSLPEKDCFGISDWCFDNLSGSHHQSPVKCCCQSSVRSPVRIIPVRNKNTRLTAWNKSNLKSCNSLHFYERKSNEMTSIYTCLTLTYTNKMFLAGRHRQVNTHKSEEVQCFVNPWVEFLWTANPGFSDVVTSSGKKNNDNKNQSSGNCQM